MRYFFKPVELEKDLLNARELAVAISDFFFEEFRGLARVTINEVSEKSVMLSIDCLANFFKTLMESINGRFLAEIIIMQSEYRLVFLIKKPQEVDLDDKALFKLVDLAKKSELTLYIEKDRLVLYAKFVDPTLKVLNVYAVSGSSVKDKFKFAFYNAQPLS